MLFSPNLDAHLDTALYANKTFYKNIVGALQYITITRPDISYVVNKTFQFMFAPNESH